MKELRLKYHRMSKKHQQKNDRMQLLFASFSFFVGYVDTLDHYSGILILIPIAAFILAFFNIVVAIWYTWFANRYGHNLEANIFRVNGIMMLITALSFQFIGKHNVQYVYYVIAILYLLFLPHIAVKARERLFIRFLPEKIVVHRLLLVCLGPVLCQVLSGMRE